MQKAEKCAKAQDKYELISAFHLSTKFCFVLPLQEN